MFATGDAQLLVFDEVSNTVTDQFTPVPGSTWIFSLARAADGTVYGVTSDGKWFEYDPVSKAVAQHGSFPLGTVTALATGPDGHVYGTSAAGLFRIDEATDGVTQLSDVGGGYYRTIAFDGGGRVYYASGTNVMRWTP